MGRGVYGSLKRRISQGVNPARPNPGVNRHTKTGKQSRHLRLSYLPAMCYICDGGAPVCAHQVNPAWFMTSARRPTAFTPPPISRAPHGGPDRLLTSTSRLSDRQRPVAKQRHHRSTGATRGQEIVSTNQVRHPRARPAAPKLVSEVQEASPHSAPDRQVSLRQRARSPLT